MHTDGHYTGQTSQERSAAHVRQTSCAPKTRLVFPSGINVVLLSNYHKTLTYFTLPLRPVRPSCAQGTFLLYRTFTRIECTKSSTVLFTRSAGDNKSVSVCVPAVLCACAHMPACAHVRVQPSPCDCASKTAVYFTRPCSWCLASGPCHDPWHCQWLTSSAFSARASTLSLHSSSPLPFTLALVFFLLVFVLASVYPH